jgi:hypothetical protein
MKKTYFTHDSNARNDIRVIKLRAKLGYEGYGLFWAILELLFSEENKLCIEDYDSLAYGLQCDPTILKQVIENFDLFVIEGDCFYSKRLYKHIEDINLKSKKAKESVKKRWSNTNVIQTNNGSNTSISKSISKSKSKSIEQRIEDFKKSIHSISGISDEDKNDFFLYWTEKNKSGTKFRAELQKTFDVNLRLKRWAANGFNKNNSKFPEHYDEAYDKRLDQAKRNEYYKHLKSLGYKSIYSPNAGTKWIKA